MAKQAKGKRNPKAYRFGGNQKHGSSRKRYFEKRRIRNLRFVG